MSEDRFQYETSRWTTGLTQAKLWFDELELNGPLNVSARLAQTDAGSAGDIKIGQTKLTIGFAQEWLAWHDHQNHERQIFWTRLAAISAIVAGASAAIGW